MSCSECKFAIYQDTGYSNYTVEGTDFYCAKGVHPSDGFDTFYGTGPGLEFGNTCTEKVEGWPVSIRVEGDGDFTDEEQEVLKLYRGI